MPTNEFDPKVMPSARAARNKEVRLLGGLPLYLIIVALVSVAILEVTTLGMMTRAQ